MRKVTVTAIIGISVALVAHTAFAVQASKPCGPDKKNCVERTTLTGKVINYQNSDDFDMNVDSLDQSSYLQFHAHARRSKENVRLLRQACPENKSYCQIDATIERDGWSNGEFLEIYSAKTTIFEKPKPVSINAGSPEEVFVKFWKSTDCKEMKALAGNMWAKLIVDRQTDDGVLCSTFVQMHKAVADVNVMSSTANTDGTVTISAILLLKKNGGNMAQGGLVGKADGKWQLFK